MRLEKLFLRDFRNYGEAEVVFAPGVNVFVGPNAQGKTNLLEAIALLSTGRSHRTGRDQEMVRRGASAYAVKAQVSRLFGRFELELSYQAPRAAPSRKAAYLNGGLVPKLSEAVGSLTAVLFAPADLDLVQGSPASRRRYLDVQLSQAGGGYLQALARYNRALLQRNTLLRRLRDGMGDPRDDRELLAPWDAELALFGGMLAAFRSRAVSELAPLAASAHDAISGGADRLEVSYVSGITGVSGGRQPIGDRAGATTVDAVGARDLLLDVLAKNRLADVARTQTSVGPHRDDLSLRINGTDARVYASQGQQRTVSLALKLAELEFLRTRTGEFPVLLLDDVFSELDSQRRRLLLELLADDVQKVITATGTEGISWAVMPGAALFDVKAGTVSRLESGDLEG